MYIIYPRTFDKDRCNPQAETERVEAQNRKLLAENQKVMFLVALDILTDREANLGKVFEKTQSAFQLKAKIENMKGMSNAMTRMLGEKKN